MKTFKDLKIGDYIYCISNFGKNCSKFKIIDIVDNKIHVTFINGDEFPWEVIMIPKRFLQQNQWGNLFADINRILECINEIV